MTPGEALMCETPSTIFKGLCFSERNCGSICEKEGFTLGHCKALKCVCAKDCNVGKTPPRQGPPDEGPPDEGPPDQGPPDQGPPGPGGDYPPSFS